jgi:hypothetical protein
MLVPWLAIPAEPASAHEEAILEVDASSLCHLSHSQLGSQTTWSKDELSELDLK